MTFKTGDIVQVLPSKARDLSMILPHKQYEVLDVSIDGSVMRLLDESGKPHAYHADYFGGVSSAPRAQEFFAVLGPKDEIKNRDLTRLYTTKDDALAWIKDGGDGRYGVITLTVTKREKYDVVTERKVRPVL